MKILEPTEINQMQNLYQNYPGPYAIDEVDLNNIFPGIESTKYKTEYFEWVHGDLPVYNLHLINRLVARLKPRVMVEIGTYRGRTSYNMALNNPKGKVITIDPINGGVNFDGNDEQYFQSEDEIGSLYKRTKLENQITQIYEDSTSMECKPLLDFHLKERGIDFAFIDGGHTYENVKYDFEDLILPRLNTGGVVVFDDYNRLYTVVGVAHYLMEKAKQDGYKFYWYAPRKGDSTNEVIWLNL